VDVLVHSPHLKIKKGVRGSDEDEKEEIGESVNRGINKINISSDIKAAYYGKMIEVLKDQGLREQGGYNHRYFSVWYIEDHRPGDGTGD